MYQAQDKDGFWSEIETAEVKQTSEDLTDIQIDIILNKRSYRVSDQINWNISVNVQNQTLYLGIILPNGSVVAINSNAEFNKQIQFARQQSIFIKTPIPEDSPLGDYLACGVLMPTGKTFKMDGSNWLALDCTGFKIQ